MKKNQNPIAVAGITGGQHAVNLLPDHARLGNKELKNSKNQLI